MKYDIKLIEAVLLFSPVIIEIAIDFILWRLKKSDKPASTIFRGVYMAFLAGLFHWIGYNTWWQTLILLLFIHLALFDALLNTFRGKGLTYHSDKGFDRIYSRIPGYAELFFKAVFLYAAIMVYSHIEMIIH
jgi:hypothetical protein